MIVLKISFLIVCTLAVIVKLYEKKSYDDWLWPISAAVWCAASF